MRDSKDNRRLKRPGERELEDALAQSMPSYTPEHRKAVLKGLRILARVAIRSYMEERAQTSPQPNDAGDGDEETGERGV